MSERNHQGSDKVSRYKWKLKNKPGYFAEISKLLIGVDPAYQRPLNETKVLAIASDFDWPAFGAINVAKRDGLYYVIDGQHRLMAARRRSDIPKIPCMVYALESQQEEARAFLSTNTLRRPIGAIARHHAALAAGDAVALQVNAAITSAGLVVSDSSGPGIIKCLSKCIDMCTRDEPRFRQALELAAALSAKDNMQVHYRLIVGIFEVIGRVDGGLTKRLSERIADVGATKLLDGMQKAVVFHGTSSARVLAEGIVTTINHGLRNRFEIINQGESTP